MPAHKSLLLRAEVKPAGRFCYWKHNTNHAITEAEARLVVQETGLASPT